MKILEGIFFRALYLNLEQQAHFNQFLDWGWIWALNNVISLVPLFSPCLTADMANVFFTAIY